MAKLTTDNLDGVEEKLKRIEAGMRGEAIRQILDAGAQVLVDAWKDTIQSKNHVRTGQMMKSVDKTEVRFNGRSSYIEVYPMGTDQSHNITNAQKAFILINGRRANGRGRGAIKADRFNKAAEKAAEEKANAAMQAALDSFTEKG